MYDVSSLGIPGTSSIVQSNPSGETPNSRWAPPNMALYLRAGSGSRTSRRMWVRPILPGSRARLLSFEPSHSCRPRLGRSQDSPSADVAKCPRVTVVPIRGGRGGVEYRALNHHSYRPLSGFHIGGLDDWTAS